MEEQKQVHPHITPTVGRVVWFWDHASDGDDHPMRADICFVNEDGTVNLSVNDHDGNAFPYRRCALHQGDAAGCSLPRPFATWMPYQKGQAAKTEAAEKAEVTANDLPTPPMLELQRQLLAEQVRELRILNDTREITLNAMKADGFSGTGAISGGVQLCAQQRQQGPLTDGR